MKKLTTKIIVASLAGLILSPVSPVFAGFHEGRSVTMGGQPVFDINAGADGYSAEHRAWLSQDRLDNALVVADNKGPDAVTVERRNGAFTVCLDGRAFATADGASAAAANMSAEQLANQWAASVRNFLSDSTRTNNYLATLTGKNPVGANVAIIERRLYAPAGLAMKVRLNSELNVATLTEGQAVEATVISDVPMGSFVIPAESTVLGEVTLDAVTKEYAITFNSLKTPSGTEVPIAVAVSTDFLVTSESPHAVCTYAIPAGEANRMPYIIGRVPASTGIGTRVGTQGLRTALILRSGDPVIAAGQPMTLLFRETTPVAVINRNLPM